MGDPGWKEGEYNETEGPTRVGGGKNDGSYNHLQIMVWRKSLEVQKGWILTINLDPVYTYLDYQGKKFIDRFMQIHLKLTVFRLFDLSQTELEKNYQKWRHKL